MAQRNTNPKVVGYGGFQSYGVLPYPSNKMGKFAKQDEIYEKSISNQKNKTDSRESRRSITFLSKLQSPSGLNLWKRNSEYHQPRRFREYQTCQNGTGCQTNRKIQKPRERERFRDQEHHGISRRHVPKSPDRASLFC